jgi:hypothetical protein
MSAVSHGRPPARAAAARDRGALGGCSLCDQLIDGPCVDDPESCAGVHAACLAGRLPQDAIVALIAALALVLAPTIVVWAG